MAKHHAGSALLIAQKRIAEKTEQKAEAEGFDKLAELATKGDPDLQIEFRKIMRKKGGKLQRFPLSTAKPLRDPAPWYERGTPLVPGGAIESKRRKH